MPDIDYNREHWNQNYGWSEDGDEWSKPWGTPLAQWSFCVLPRINSLLFGSKSVLEIGTGRGRWTNFLLSHCSRYQGIDISQKCIEFCKSRFSACGHASFYANEGTSLDMIEDDSIDFTFSFDSLVHADAKVMEAYLNGLGKKLKNHGVAFLHHSNLGEYPNFFADLAFISYPEQRRLMKKGLVTNDNGRDRAVSAELIRELCGSAGLVCSRQEIVNWGGDLMMDCFSTIVRGDSGRENDTQSVRNDQFMAEARHISKLSSLYG